MTTVTTTKTAALTASERGRLAELEAVVERGMTTFVEVGRALTEIRDARLYRATHDTFDRYCKDRWAFTASRGRQLVAAAGIASQLESVTRVTVPSERHARELGPVVRSHGASTAARALERAEGSTVEALRASVAVETAAPTTIDDVRDFGSACAFVRYVIRQLRDAATPRACVEALMLYQVAYERVGDIMGTCTCTREVHVLADTRGVGSHGENAESAPGLVMAMIRASAVCTDRCREFSADDLRAALLASVDPPWREIFAGVADLPAKMQLAALAGIEGMCAARVREIRDGATGLLDAAAKQARAGAAA